MLVSVFVFGIN